MEKSAIIEKISEMKRKLDEIETIVIADKNKEELKYDFVIEDISTVVADKIHELFIQFVRSFKLEVANENNQIVIKNNEMNRETIKEGIRRILRHYIHEPR